MLKHTVYRTVQRVTTLIIEKPKKQIATEHPVCEQCYDSLRQGADFGELMKETQHLRPSDHAAPPYKEGEQRHPPVNRPLDRRKVQFFKERILDKEKPESHPVNKPMILGHQVLVFTPTTKKKQES